MVLYRLYWGAIVQEQIHYSRDHAKEIDPDKEGPGVLKEFFVLNIGAWLVSSKPHYDWKNIKKTVEGKQAIKFFAERILKPQFLW